MRTTGDRRVAGPEGPGGHRRRRGIPQHLTGSRTPTRLRGVPPTTDAEAALRSASLRVTRPRVAVLTALSARPHSTTDAVIEAVRADLGEVSHQAVYDVLRVLTRA